MADLPDWPTTMHPHVATCTNPDCKICDTEQGLTYAACAYPRENRGDGRGCGVDDCPRHGGDA